MSIVNAPLLLDTNILLNGIFVPQSKARDVLFAVQTKKVTAYVIENSLREANAVIRRAHHHTGVDLSRPFHAAMHSLGLVILPGISQPESAVHDYVKGSGDRAIAAAAQKLGFGICTSDKQDFINAPAHGILVISPEELVQDGAITLQSHMPGALATHREGTFYAEVGFLGWMGTDFQKDAAELMYLFDVEGIGSLYFEASTKSFRFQIDHGPTLRIPWGIVLQEHLPLKFVATYKHNSGVHLYIGYRGRHASTSDRWISGITRPSGRLYLGCDRHGANQLSGAIFLVFGLPASVSEKAANNIMRGATTLHPWDRLSLEEIIDLMYSAS